MIEAMSSASTLLATRGHWSGVKCEGDFNDVFFCVIIAIKEAGARKSGIVSGEKESCRL